MPTVYVALGSNLGDRELYIRKALAALQETGMTVEKLSSLIETAPVGGPPQGKFLNAVLKGRTELSPEDFLKTLQTIETKLGRVRTVKDGPRTIDLDLLLYDQVTLNTPQLTIPHPRMLDRDFVMIPLAEIAPQLAKELSDA